MLKSLVVAASLALAAPAAAVTVVVDQSASLANVSFYQTSQTVVLPTGFTSALLNITSLSADDAAIITVNGTSIYGAGIFGPGTGFFYFSASGPSTAFGFANNGAANLSFTAPFVAGNNIIEVFYNNNNAGINTGNGPLTEGPGDLNFVGTVSFNTVPEPQTWALLVIGFGLVGVSARRRKGAVAA